MKRGFALLTALLLCMLTACGETVNQKSSSQSQESQAVQQEPSSHGEVSLQPEESEPAAAAEAHVLVAYFSATGNTKAVAQNLQALLHADLYEILPEDPYTDEDLAYNNDNCRANREQNDPAARPAISGTLPHPEDYDVIFLGYPIWWGQAPKVIDTFLEGTQFGEVTIVPFCTSGSSGIGSSAENLHPLAPDANWLEGQRFGAGAVEEEIAQWIDSLKLPQLPDAER